MDCLLKQEGGFILLDVNEFVEQSKSVLASFSFGDLFIDNIDESQLGSKQTLIIGFSNPILRDHFNQMIKCGVHVNQIKERYFATYLGGEVDETELRKYRFKKIEIVVDHNDKDNQSQELMESPEFKMCLKYYIGNENGITFRFTRDLPF
jgi:hypothetical protein